MGWKMTKTLPYTTLKLLIFTCSLLLFGCGKEKEEEIEEAIDTANIFLSSRICGAAISILEGVGRQNTNARYLQTLASAYACKSDFDEPTFFGTDMPNIASPAPLGGLTTFNSSLSMDSSSDKYYTNLWSAINILLYAGGIGSGENPTVAERADYFNNADAGDINAQLAYMLLAQLGKFAFFYGNVDAGVKGDGTQGNDCFIEYDEAAVLAYLATGNTGGCTNLTNTGHANLGTPGSYSVARLCQGVILFNSIVDALPGVISAAGGDDFNDLDDLLTDIDGYKTDYTDAGGDPTIFIQQNQTGCETDNAADDTNLQLFFGFIMETLFI